MHDLVLGAIIAIVSSAVTTIVTSLLTNLIQQSGQVKVYYKFVHKVGSKSEKRWGAEDRAEGRTFYIPMRVEISNTTNASHIVRDLKASLYYNNTFVEDMVSVELYEKYDKNDNKQKSKSFGDEGRFSFVLPPRTIQQYELLYTIKLNSTIINYDEVNRIRLTYFDSRNKQKGGFIIEAENLLSKSSSEMSNWTKL
jgi:hypothetical protein